MPYRDVDRECVFEVKPGEDWHGAEHYTVVCPQCGATVTGKVPNRSRWTIATNHGWVLLARPSTLYCTRACARAHAPAAVESHLLGLRKTIEAGLKEAASWVE